MKRRSSSKARGRSVSLRNFTGKVRLNPDTTVDVLGAGHKVKTRRKRTTRRRVARRRRR